MTESEIRNIFVEELTNKNTNTAVIRSYYRILLVVLEKVAKPWTEEKNWKLLEENVAAKSLLCVFMSIGPGDFITHPNLVNDLGVLYQHWLKIIIYLYDNYQTTYCLKFKSQWTMLDLMEIKKSVIEKNLRIQRQISSKKSVGFNDQELPIMDTMINLLFLVILGEEVMKLFIIESNEAFKILKKFKRELIPA